MYIGTWLYYSVKYDHIVCELRSINAINILPNCAHEYSNFRSIRLQTYYKVKDYLSKNRLIMVCTYIELNCYNTFVQYWSSCIKIGEVSKLQHITTVWNSIKIITGFRLFFSITIVISYVQLPNYLHFFSKPCIYSNKNINTIPISRCIFIILVEVVHDFRG